MSKSLKNYPDPGVMINQYGADAMRFVHPNFVSRCLCDLLRQLQNVSRQLPRRSSGNPQIP